jgi:hypothetical protein
LRRSFIETRYRIGGVVIALVCRDVRAGGRNQRFSCPEPGYAAFLTDAEPDVVVESRVGSLPDLGAWEPVFDSNAVWRLYRQDGRWAVQLSSPERGAYRVGIFSSGFLNGEIHSTGDSAAVPEPFPLQFPLAELLMIHLLACGRGLLLHACAVRDGDDGVLFAGVSGAGKSTMASLWREHSGATLLSDDRVILREHEDGFWIYGTPWHGDAGAASPERARLRRIFLLRHGPENRAIPLLEAQAGAALLVRAFPTFWDPPGMEFTLQLMDRLSRGTPAYALDFVPDGSVVKYVRSLSEQHP